MNEQNRQRLGRIAKRHASRMTRTQGEAGGDEAFLAEFVRARDEVLRPVMEEIGSQLREEGYEFRVVDAGSEKLPAIELRVVIPRREGSKDTIRFFAHKDTQRGWQVIAEIEFTRSPMELARFDAGDPISREIAEHLVVDATEQMFASALAAPGGAARQKGASAAPDAAATAKSVGAEASATLEGAEGVRALVLGRMRDGRVLHGLDFVGADLHGLDFTGALMPGLDLRRANLRGCVLARANLVAARFQGADLTDAVLAGANLSRANLSKALLAGARFDDAVMVDAIGVPPPEPLEEMPVSAPEPAAGPPRPSDQCRVPAPPLPLEAPARLPVESLPVAKPSAPVVATEPPAFVASRRSPLAATSMALDLPIGPALPFAKSADDTLPLPPPKPRSLGGAADTPSPLPTTPLRVSKAHAHLAGTVDLPNLPIGPALPFPQSPGAQAPASPPSPTNPGKSGLTPAAPTLPRVNKAAAHLAGTVDLPNLPIGPALPFAQSPGGQAPPVPPWLTSGGEIGPTSAAPALPRVNKAPAQFTGSSAFDPNVAAALPFAQGAAGEPPSLTVEEYASFRANLAVKGEEDPATWKQFGIASQAMKEALQVRFAARFRHDPEVRDRFVALLQRTVNELRAKAPGA